jgi:predicted NBD/HSP70 family sugar kinase
MPWPFSIVTFPLLSLLLLKEGVLKMTLSLDVIVPTKPTLDPGFVPALLWNRAYQSLVDANPESIPIALALTRTDDTVSIFETRILPHAGDAVALNRKYIERLVKFLLWQKGGYRITVGGSPEVAAMLRDIYSPTGLRAFDVGIVGKKMYGQSMVVEDCAIADMPASRETSKPLGRNLNGCRIGFDLGGSDRKAAALVDGDVVFSEEITWSPYFEKDPSYHIKGIQETLTRAAEHLPHVDAIGGSAAGVYINNEVRVASLFRGISEEAFETHVRRLFFDLQARWNNIPLEVVNDGEVTALAGSMSMGVNAVLGVSMGTSTAAGYVTASGNITPWLNELAFVPVDYRDDAPADEWSGDIGCGVQYFSQQAVARLAPEAGIELAEDMPLPEKLVEVQKLVANNDERAVKIYETIGTYFGYSIAHFAEFYDIGNLLILGRVTSGRGGEIIIEKTEALLKSEFAELEESIKLRTPDEKSKRHGQAIAAASLPEIG